MKQARAASFSHDAAEHGKGLPARDGLQACQSRRLAAVTEQAADVGG